MYISRRRPLVGESTPKRYSTRLCSSSDCQDSLSIPQNTPRISDTRKGPPPFINFEEHLNATNGGFTIPALNLSLNSPASILLDRPAPGTPVPSAQNHFAVEGQLGRQPPTTIPSPTLTLVGEPDTSTGEGGVPNTSHGVPLTPHSAPGNTRNSQFPIDARPRKPLPSSRKSNRGNNVHDMSARMNPTARSYSTDTALLQHQRMAPPVPPSRSAKVARTFSESGFDPRPAKRLKTSQTTRMRNGVGCVIRHIQRISHLQSSQKIFRTSRINRINREFTLAAQMVLRTGLQAFLTYIPSAMLYKPSVFINLVMRLLIQVHRDF